MPGGRSPGGSPGGIPGGPPVPGGGIIGGRCGCMVCPFYLSMSLRKNFARGEY